MTHLLLSQSNTIGLIAVIVLVSLNLVVIFYLLSEKDKKDGK